jgi:hypothetical protein
MATKEKREQFMRTMQELRIDIRDKLPELQVRLEMKAAEMGVQGILLSAPDMESYYDHILNEHCYFVLLACDAWREWLYDKDGSTFLTYESELLDWLDADDGEQGVEGFYHDLDKSREDFPSEVQDCNHLLDPILDAGIAKGLEDDDLFEYTWLMMSPFLTGRESSPTEADWQKKKVTLTLERAVKADEDRQLARTMLERSIRDSLAKDREYTLSLLLGILAEVKES